MASLYDKTAAFDVTLPAREQISLIETEIARLRRRETRRLAQGRQAQGVRARLKRLESRTLPDAQRRLSREKANAEPIVGEMSRAVVREARKASVEPEAAKLLLLLAAYRDGGTASPSVKDLVLRMKFETGSAGAHRVDGLLRDLIRKRMIYVRWGRRGYRNTYVLTCLGERPGEERG